MTKFIDRTKQQDLERELILKAQGFQIIRFTNQQIIEDIRSVLKAIAVLTGLIDK